MKRKDKRNQKEKTGNMNSYERAQISKYCLRIVFKKEKKVKKKGKMDGNKQIIQKRNIHDR